MGGLKTKNGATVTENFAVGIVLAKSSFQHSAEHGSKSNVMKDNFFKDIIFSLDHTSYVCVACSVSFIHARSG